MNRDNTRTTATLAPIRSWLTEPLEPAVVAALERVRRTDDVQHVAVMPDVHLAADVCIGTVIATSRLLFPPAVGGDIGCGMLALAFDAGANDLLGHPARAGALLKHLYATVPAARHHRARGVPLPSDLAADALSHGALQAIVRDEGALQLGTLGGGNHFVEFQADKDDDRLWLMIHSGSRCMGQAVRRHHLARAVRAGSSSLLALDAQAGPGQAYVHDMRWACRFADANRRAMAEAIVGLMRREFAVPAVENSLIVCDHNHLAHETHFGHPLWVHRKGAMPAAADMAGLVPGSMGTKSFHVRGRGCAESLQSSAHGAGRALSRTAARKKIRAIDLQRQMQGVWFDHRQAAALREEAPAAYKDIAAVLRAQHELVWVVQTLRPILNFKGGR